MNSLQLFALRALRELPTALWWVLAALLSAVLSLVFRKEVFPNTPAAAAASNWVLTTCGLLLPPLGIWWLWRVAALVEHPGWRLLWYMGAVGGTMVLLLLLVILGLLRLTTLL